MSGLFKVATYAAWCLSLARDDPPSALRDVLLRAVVAANGGARATPSPFDVGDTPMPTPPARRPRTASAPVRAESAAAAERRPTRLAARDDAVQAAGRELEQQRAL